MQLIKIKSGPPIRIRKWNQIKSTQMTYIYKKDTYRNDLDWLYFNHQPRTQGNKQV